MLSSHASVDRYDLVITRLAEPILADTPSSKVPTRSGGEVQDNHLHNLLAKVSMSLATVVSTLFRLFVASNLSLLLIDRVKRLCDNIEGRGMIGEQVMPPTCCTTLSRNGTITTEGHRTVLIDHAPITFQQTYLLCTILIARLFVCLSNDLCNYVCVCVYQCRGNFPCPSKKSLGLAPDQPSQVTNCRKPCQQLLFVVSTTCSK